MRKVLYGLKKALIASNKNIDGFIREIGFMKCASEHGVYGRRNNNNELIILCLYVDDLLVTSSSENEVDDIKLDLLKEFEITDLGLISYFLGIEFYKHNRGLLMHQTRYASQIPKRFEIKHYNSIITLPEPRLQLTKDPNERGIDPTHYRRLVGSLRYLFHKTHDLAYSVGVTSRVMQKPNLSHLSATKRILRYIRGTLDYGILFIATNK